MNYRSDLYKHHILDLAKNPHNYGLVADADFSSKRLNPSCGDVLTMCGFVLDGNLDNVRFEASGCVISIAMASLLTSFVQNMSVEKALCLDEQTIEQLLEMQLGINRLQCGMLAILALQDGIRNFIEQKKLL
jgi:nitrogen fixation NifU-like protein